MNHICLITGMFLVVFDPRALSGRVSNKILLGYLTQMMRPLNLAIVNNWQQLKISKFYWISTSQSILGRTALRKSTVCFFLLKIDWTLIQFHKWQKGKSIELIITLRQSLGIGCSDDFFVALSTLWLLAYWQNTSGMQTNNRLADCFTTWISAFGWTIVRDFILIF